MAYEFYGTELRYAHTSFVFRESGAGNKFATVEIEAPSDRVLLITGIENAKIALFDVVAVVSASTLITEDQATPVVPATSKFGGVASSAILHTGKRTAALDDSSLRIMGDSVRRFDEIPLCIPASSFFSICAASEAQALEIEVEWLEISTR